MKALIDELTKLFRPDFTKKKRMIRIVNKYVHPAVPKALTDNVRPKAGTDNIIKTKGGDHESSTEKDIS